MEAGVQHVGWFAWQHSLGPPSPLELGGSPTRVDLLYFSSTIPLVLFFNVNACAVWAFLGHL